MALSRCDLNMSCHEQNLVTLVTCHLKLGKKQRGRICIQTCTLQTFIKDSLQWFILKGYYHVPWRYSYAHWTTAAVTCLYILIAAHSAQLHLMMILNIVWMFIHMFKRLKLVRSTLFHEWGLIRRTSRTYPSVRIVLFHTLSGSMLVCWIPFHEATRLLERQSTGMIDLELPQSTEDKGDSLPKWRLGSEGSFFDHVFKNLILTASPSVETTTLCPFPSGHHNSIATRSARMSNSWMIETWPSLFTCSRNAVSSFSLKKFKGWPLPSYTAPPRPEYFQSSNTAST